MNKRCCLAIGASSYINNDTWLDLPGAEKDARKYYQYFVDEKSGYYDPSLSKLLISPKLEDLKNSIWEISRQSDGIDNFTFIFSGHGHIVNESFFMCMNDTDVNNMSLSSYSMNDLMSFVNEKRFPEVNIIIDACNAGGAVEDFGRFVNSKMFGVNESIAVTCLAGAYAYESAYETDEGGVLSSEIFKVIDGTLKISEMDEYLDLIRVSTHVSREIRKQGKQQPVYWSAGCIGQNFLVKNVHFSEESSIADSIMKLFPNRQANRDKFKEYQDELARIYYSVGSSFEKASLLNVIEKISDETDDEFALASFVITLRAKYWAVAKEVNDLSTPFEILNIFSIATSKVSNLELKKYLWSDSLNYYSEYFEDFFRWIESNLNEDYPFLYGNGFSDWFYVPLRFYESLSVLGCFLAFQKLVNNSVSLGQINVIKAYLKKFLPKIRLICDSQASCLINFFNGLKIMEVEGVVDVKDFRCLLNKILDEDCFLLRPHYGGEDVVKFMFYKSYRANGAKIPYEVMSRHTTMLTALLIGACGFSYSDVLDEFLWELDRKTFRLFIPDTFRDFHLATMREGKNYEYSIGRDVFTSDDCIDVMKQIKEVTQNNLEGLNDFEIVNCMFLANLFPDRQLYKFL